MLCVFCVSTCFVCLFVFHSYNFVSNWTFCFRIWLFRSKLQIIFCFLSCEMYVHGYNAFSTLRKRLLCGFFFGKRKTRTWLEMVYYPLKNWYRFDLRLNESVNISHKWNGIIFHQVMYIGFKEIHVSKIIIMVLPLDHSIFFFLFV